MNKQICRRCGNEMVTESIVPMTFCTNCGASLNYSTADNFVMHRPVKGRGPARYSRGEKMIFGALVAIPVLLILGGVGVFAFLIFASSRTEPRIVRYPTPQPTASATPKQATNRLWSTGSEGLGDGQFKNARSVAVDRAGNIYVGDGAQRIQKFDAQGKFLQVWNVRDTALTVDENYGRGITNLAVDSKNVLYVVVQGKELLRYDTSGKFLGKVPLYGEKWLNKPQEAMIADMKMLPDDKLAVYATSFPEGEYFMLVAPDGTSEIKHKHLLKKQESSASILMNVTMLVGPTGDLFLLYEKPGREKPYIYRFKSDGSYVDRFTWGNTSRFNWKRSIALNAKGEIFAYNPDAKQVEVLTVDGVLTRAFPLDATSIEEMVVEESGTVIVLKRDKLEKYTTTN